VEPALQLANRNLLRLLVGIVLVDHALDLAGNQCTQRGGLAGGQPLAL
jgi:hypothetical protein